MKKILKTSFKLLAIVLVFWILTLLLSQQVVTSRVPVALWTRLEVFSSDDSYVNAKGTWVIENERSADPLQATNITCSKERKNCTVATARISNKTLHVDNDNYDIVEWDNGRIVFVDGSPSCVSYIYTIDTLTKTVNSIRRKRAKPKHPSDSCDGVASELRSTLKDGFWVWRDLQEEAIPWFGKLAMLPFRVFQ